MPKPRVIPNELFTYERMRLHWTQGDVADNIGAPDVKTIGRWERGEVAPSPYYQLKLAEVFGKSARALGFPPDGQISFWHVPYRRNAFFTGREDILQLLRDTLLAQQASPVPRLPLALSGIPGVGKSQIALEYAYRYREHYHTVLWLHAASYQDLVSAVIAAADLLDLPGKNEANPEQLIDALKEWLTQLTRWLLIFDNVENFQLLTGFIPAEIKGHVLLMTLSQNTGTHAYRIAVEPMDNTTGAELLLRRAKLIAIESTLEPTAGADVAVARSLAEDMGGLPLALDQAGAYVEETKMSLSEYAQRYQKQRRDLLDRRGSRVSEYSEHPIPVAATFRLSFDKACERHPLASDILHICSLCPPDLIPARVFEYDDSFKYGTTEFDDAIAALLRYSLIKRNMQGNIFSVHRLVQAVLKDAMPLDIRKQWRSRLLQAILVGLPVDFPDWAGYEHFLSQHVLPWLRYELHIEDELHQTLGVAEVLLMFGHYLRERGHPLAESVLVRALSHYEQRFGVENTISGVLNIASALIELSLFYFTQDMDGQAEPLIKRAISIQERYLDAEHPDTALSLHMLAAVFHMQDKYKQAELLYRRAIRIWEEQPEVDNLKVANALCGLALLLHDQGKHRQAGTLYQRALSMLEQRLGITDPYTQAIMRDYADYLQSIGHDAEVAAMELIDEPSV